MRPAWRLDVFYDWMLQTFRVRNFTDEGLCHYVLRSALDHVESSSLEALQRDPSYLQSLTDRVAKSRDWACSLTSRTSNPPKPAWSSHRR